MKSLNPTQRFTRFINYNSKFKPNGDVRPKAFLPSKKERSKNPCYISVFLTENMVEHDIIELGRKNTEPKLVGRAHLDARKVMKNTQLTITINNISTGHANLGPFPKFPSDRETKEIELHLASQLAKISNSKKGNTKKYAIQHLKTGRQRP